jgi:hypothetical protein
LSDRLSARAAKMMMATTRRYCLRLLI